MAIDISESTNRASAATRLAKTGDEDREIGSLPADDVIARVNENLGYDLFETALMIEGYYELGDEMLVISESTLSAQAETLPQE
jgi:hypothetical protein